MMKTTCHSPEKLRIIVDTREQRAWHFPEELVDVVSGGLRTGDYALEGDNKYAIERKSLDDFVGTVSSGWPRFCRELKRMEQMDAQTIIVEANINEVLEHKYNHPEVCPAMILKRVAELSVRNVSVLFCDNPTTAAGMCYTILKLRKGLLNGSDYGKGEEDSVSES